MPPFHKGGPFGFDSRTFPVPDTLIAITGSGSWFVPAYEASIWSGIGAPRNTPTGIVEKLNKEINAAFAEPKLRARLEGLGGMVLAGSPADFGKLIADETERWGKVIRAANIKVE